MKFFSRNRNVVEERENRILSKSSPNYRLVDSIKTVTNIGTLLLSINSLMKNEEGSQDILLYSLRDLAIWALEGPRKRRVRQRVEETGAILDASKSNILPNRLDLDAEEQKLCANLDAEETELFDSGQYLYYRVFKNKDNLNNFLNNSSDEIIDYGEAIVFSKGNYSTINIQSTIYDKGSELNYSKIITIDNDCVDIITSINSSRSGKILREDGITTFKLQGNLWRYKNQKNQDVLQTYKKYKKYIVGKQYIIEDSKKILLSIDIFYKK